ncbi:MAG: DMT family transporter [Candidatus Yanofskybacteria bacterium]|nr:DMT family transporter [Candidatus Yanofskybacteria bacterium]
MTEKAYILTLVGALVFAIYNIIVKKQLPHWQGREAVFTAVVAITAGLLLVAFGAIEVDQGNRGMWWPVAATGLLNIGILYFNTKAKSLSDVSLVVPISAGTPTIVVLTSMLILGERVTFVGWVGIMLTAIGTYLINIRDYLDKKTGRLGWRDYLAPFLALSRDRGVRCALWAVGLASISLNYDGLVARRANSIGLGFGLVFLITALGNVVIATKQKEWGGCFEGGHIFRKTTGVIFAGVLYAGAVWLLSAPLQWALVPYIGTLKRLQIPMVTILAYLFLKERVAFKSRLLGGTIMATGAALIGLS